MTEQKTLRRIADATAQGTPPRNLETICHSDEEGFGRVLRGVAYCSIRITNPGVQCQYRDEKATDGGLYRCNSVRYLIPVTELKQ